MVMLGGVPGGVQAEEVPEADADHALLVLLYGLHELQEDRLIRDGRAVVLLGNFADLSSYFGNDAFPGLKNAFSEDFVQAMTSYIRQEDGSYQKGIYGINLCGIRS